MAALPPMKCLSYHPLEKPSPLKGFAEIEITTSFGPLVFRDVRLIQQEGQKAFVSPPQKEFQGKDGEKKYSRLVDWPREWGDQILKIVQQYSESQIESRQHLTVPDGDIPF